MRGRGRSGRLTPPTGTNLGKLTSFAPPDLGKQTKQQKEREREKARVKEREGGKILVLLFQIYIKLHNEVALRFILITFYGLKYFSVKFH